MGVPHTKIAEERISLRKITDDILGQTDTGENVLRLLKITKIQHTYIVSSQTIKNRTFQFIPFKRFSHLRISFFFLQECPSFTVQIVILMKTD